MQRIFFIWVALLFIACNNSADVSSENSAKKGADSIHADADESDLSEVDACTPLDKTTAEAMITTFNTDSHVDHTQATEIQRIELDPKTLNKLYKKNNATRFRLYTAAYLGTDANTSRRYKKTILLQFKNGSNAPVYYDVSTLCTKVRPSGGAICPPPDGSTCGVDIF